MKKQLVSVIMPAFNASAFISDSIDSILKQSYKNLELIICDDCSSDETLDLASQFSKYDNRINLISNSTTLGIAQSRNRCISIAKGEIIAFCDSDDVWQNDKLELQVKKLLSEDYSVISSNCYIIDASGKKIGKRIYPKIITKKMMRFRNFIINSSAIFKKEDIDIIFEEIKHEDYLYWLNIVKKNVYCFQQPLINYRVHESNFTNNKIKSLIWHYYVWRKKGESLFIIPILFFLNLISRYKYRGGQ